MTGDPVKAVDSLQGRIWRKTIERSELSPPHEATYQVVSTRLYGGRTRLHVFSDTRPDAASFAAVAPDLEDVYFTEGHQGLRYVPGGEARRLMLLRIAVFEVRTRLRTYSPPTSISSSSERSAASGWPWPRAQFPNASVTMGAGGREVMANSARSPR